MKVNIIGGGISGLTAAYYLEKGGHETNIIEKTDRVGGRIKTDKIGGYSLDHGFQVFLSAYPEAKAILDYDALDLKYFMAGSAIHTRNGLQEIGDPARELSLLFKTIFSPLATFGDKWKTYTLKKKVKSQDINKIFATPSTTTKEFLYNRFSKTYVDEFFAPFYKGIFLDNDLSTSSQMFHFVFKMFSEGFATIPANGMEEIPKQLAGKLEKTRFFLNEEVLGIKDNVVTTSSGKAIEADVTLIATQASGLIQDFNKDIKTEFRSVYNLYFSSDSFEYELPAIMLTPHAQWVNNVCCINKVSPNYNSNQNQLISVSVIPEHHHTIDDIEQKVISDLNQYYDTSSWQHIKTYHIPYALPNQDKVLNYLTSEHYKIKDGLYMCGDHLYNGSINAAMKTGRLAAKSIMKSFTTS